MPVSNPNGVNLHAFLLIMSFFTEMVSNPNRVNLHPRGYSIESGYYLFQTPTG